MNSGPSATFGIMFSVTNSGSSNRLTSGDQVNMHGQHDADEGAEAEAAEDFRSRHREVGEPGIFGRSQRREGRERRGQDEFRHLEGIDQHLPEHDHGKVHDQDDRERSRRSSSVAEQDMLPGCDAAGSRPAHGGNLSRLRTIFQPLVD